MQCFLKERQLKLIVEKLLNGIRDELSKELDGNIKDKIKDRKDKIMGGAMSFDVLQVCLNNILLSQGQYDALQEQLLDLIQDEADLGNFTSVVSKEACNKIKKLKSTSSEHDLFKKNEKERDFNKHCILLQECIVNGLNNLPHFAWDSESLDSFFYRKFYGLLKMVVHDPRQAIEYATKVLTELDQKQGAIDMVDDDDNDNKPSLR